MTELWLDDAVWHCVDRYDGGDAAQQLLHAAAMGLSAAEARFAADQIEGRRLARDKYPALAAVSRFVFPPKLNREQSSSQATALYKAGIAAKCKEKQGGAPFSVVDITGGMGVDDLFMAPQTDVFLHIERDEALSRMAEWNFRQMGRGQITTLCADSVEWLRQSSMQCSLLLADPARRDANGHKTVDMSNCEPDLLPLLPQIFLHASRLLIKASPMIDIHQAVTQIGCVEEVHVVACKGECKEVLFLCSKSLFEFSLATGSVSSCGAESSCANEAESPLAKGAVSSLTRKDFLPREENIFSSRGRKQEATEPLVCCASLNAGGEVLSRIEFTFGGEAQAEPVYAASIGTYLYEPNAALMKAGPYRSLCRWFDVSALGRNTHLYTADRFIADFPGRGWEVLRTVKLTATEMKAVLPEGRAHVACRNYPVGAEQLLRQLHLREGGDLFVIATTIGTCKIGLLCRSLSPHPTPSCTDNQQQKRD